MQQPWEKCLRVTLQQELGGPSTSCVPCAWHSWRMDQDPEPEHKPLVSSWKRHPNKGNFDSNMIFFGQGFVENPSGICLSLRFFIATLGSERAVPSLQDLPGWDKIQGKLETWQTPVVESEPEVAF